MNVFQNEIALEKRKAIIGKMKQATLEFPEQKCTVTMVCINYLKC